MRSLGMARTRHRINLLNSEREELERLIRGPSTPQQVARRARIVWLANGEAWTNRAIADELGSFEAHVTVRTERWIERAMEPVADRLGDRPRCGRPDTKRRSNPTAVASG
jgi:putative transposase